MFREYAHECFEEGREDRRMVAVTEAPFGSVTAAPVPRALMLMTITTVECVETSKSVLGDKCEFQVTLKATGAHGGWKCGMVVREMITRIQQVTS